MLYDELTVTGSIILVTLYNCCMMNHMQKFCVVQEIHVCFGFFICKWKDYKEANYFKEILLSSVLNDYDHRIQKNCLLSILCSKVVISYGIMFHGHFTNDNIVYSL